jgi:DUF2924 family protein
MSVDTADDVEVEIDRLCGLDLVSLQLSWRAVFGRAAPALSKSLLLHLLTYRLQAQAFGDLSSVTRKLLDGLVNEDFDSDSDAAVPLPGQGQLMPGTVLSRLRASNTAVILRAFWTSAASAVGAMVATPAESCAWSGAACASPWPLTVMMCGISAAMAAGAAVNPRARTAAESFARMM